MRTYLIFLMLMVIAPLIGIGQDSYIEDFSDATLSSEWNFPHATYAGEISDGALVVEYDRTADSWVWDQFNIQFENPFEVQENPFIKIRIRSSENINLVLKPENTTGGSDWLEEYITGDSQWNEVIFQMTNTQSLPVKAMYIYFDPGNSSDKSATVDIDYISIGEDIVIPLDTKLLERAIEDASNLSQHISIGVEDGDNSEADSTYLIESISFFEGLLSSIDDSYTQSSVDSLAYALYDVCTHIEQRTYYDLPISTVDDSLIYSAKILIKNLHKLKGPRFLYGMHDATGYGVNWSGDDDRSDVKDVTGSYPAFFSWDANQVIRDQSKNRLTYRIKSSHSQGVVTSYCWHQYDPTGVSFYSSDISNSNQVGNSLLPGNANNEFYKNKLQKIAHYAKSMRAEDGRTIPIIFRPYHEHNGWWFWWGSGMPEQDYIDLWQYTVEYLRDELNVHNLLYAFSPDGGQISNVKPYKYRYPGDEYVDILGLDFYFDSGAATEIDRFIGHVEASVALADSLGKVAAVTEIGDRDALQINKWHTKVVLDPIKQNELASKIAYLSTWRNESIEHHFAPFPGHSSEIDFLEFYSDTSTIFLNNMVKGISDNIYTDKLNEKSDAAFIFRYKLKNGPQFTMNDLLIQYGGPLNFNYSNATPIFSYSDLAAVTIDGTPQVSDSSKVNLSLPTSYTVLSENGEVERSYEVIIDNLITSTSELVNDNDVELDIYPLPAREYINIECSRLMTDIQIMNESGQLLSSVSTINSRKHQLTDLEQGLIILNITLSTGQTLIRKVIIH